MLMFLEFSTNTYLEVRKYLDFNDIYSSFQPKIYRYVVRLVGREEAEDLTQEVFIRVNKALNSLQKEEQLAVWMYRIATNVAIDRMRNSSFQRQQIKPMASDFAEADISDSVKDASFVGKTSVETQVIHNEMNKCIRGIIEMLPDNYRMVIILSELEGLPNKEIADILGLSLDVVKARLHRGRAKLKKELLHCCNFSWDERNEFTCEAVKERMPKPI
ncbi:MAG: sigW [Firmicutes bacterium]|nr:sigW [Bacillota bacterium]